MQRDPGPPPRRPTFNVSDELYHWMHHAALNARVPISTALEALVLEWRGDEGLQERVTQRAQAIIKESGGARRRRG